MALQAAQYGYLLETGKIALHGRTEKLIQDDHVRGTYLGAG
jgi:branched-chain amino acid transport system ATP-binding protein